MDIKGKRVLFLGDSITQGFGVRNPENRFTDVFERRTGAKVLNYGLGGSRIAKQRVATFPAASKAERDFLIRVDEDINETDVDLVVIFGGSNDFAHGDAPLGSFSSTDEYTFYGALHSLIAKLYKKLPRARVVFMTPLHRTLEDYPINLQGLGRALLIDYVNAIREVCEFYAVPVLDLYKNSGIQPAVQANKMLYMPDGVHPSDEGAERIAILLEAFLKTI